VGRGGDGRDGRVHAVRPGQEAKAQVQIGHAAGQNPEGQHMPDGAPGSAELWRQMGNVPGAGDAVFGGLQPGNAAVGRRDAD
jgi:hypothetical protein